jgi:hypothetical protein
MITWIKNVFYKATPGFLGIHGSLFILGTGKLIQLASISGMPLCGSNFGGSHHIARPRKWVRVLENY